MGLLDALLSMGKAERKALPKLAPGGLNEIVGESFYGRAFRKIANQLGASTGQEVFVDLELRLDPNNPHSKSGKAVAVFAFGQKVGHVPESQCSTLYDVIVQRDTAAGAPGRIYFDDFANPRPRHSVAYEADFPPRFSDEPAQSVAFSQLSSEEQDGLNEKRKARIRGEGPELPQLQAGDEIDTEDVRGFDLKVLEKILGVHGVKTGRFGTAKLHVVAGPDSWNSRKGLEKLLKKDIPSVHLDDFFERYPQFLPEPELQEAISAARDWLAAYPDSNAAEKLFVKKAAKSGSLVLRGHAVVGGNPVDGGVSKFALYEGRVMKEHRENLRNLAGSLGAQLYDKILVVADIRRDDQKNRYYLSANGFDLCAMYAEQRDYFDIVTSAKRKDLLEISWIGNDIFSVNVFSFYFHY